MVPNEILVQEVLGKEGETEVDGVDLTKSGSRGRSTLADTGWNSYHVPKGHGWLLRIL